jgi:hypothetical protein
MALHLRERNGDTIDSRAKNLRMAVCLLIVAVLAAFIRIGDSSPTPTPTYAPTAVPTTINQLPPSAIPIAMHQLVVVENAGSSVIRLKSYDVNSYNVSSAITYIYCVRQISALNHDLMLLQIQYKVSSLPQSGSVYQLSQVYSAYGYEPKAGNAVTTTNTVVTGSNNRIYYKRPSPDAAGLDKVNINLCIVVCTQTNLENVPFSGIVSPSLQ